MQERLRAIPSVHNKWIINESRMKFGNRNASEFDFGWSNLSTSVNRRLARNWNTKKSNLIIKPKSLQTYKNRNESMRKCGSKTLKRL